MYVDAPGCRVVSVPPRVGGLDRLLLTEACLRESLRKYSVIPTGYTHIHSFIHTFIHTYIHVHTCTYKHTYKQTYLLTRKVNVHFQ